MNCKHGDIKADCWTCYLESHEAQTAKQRAEAQYDRVKRALNRQCQEYWLALIVIAVAIVICLSVWFGWGKP